MEKHVKDSAKVVLRDADVLDHGQPGKADIGAVDEIDR